MLLQNCFRLIKFVQAYFLVLLLGALCSTVSAQEWITDEVLKQLSEIRQELKILQEDVRSLKGTNQKSSVTKPDISKAESISLSGSPFIGSASAQIAIVEFSDYQCSYCRRHFQQTMPQIQKAYVDTGKVKYVMKQFPLGFHSKARGASVAALCADKLKSGNYFKAHEAIFSGNMRLERSNYVALANSLGLSQIKYEACLDNPKTSKVVDQDMAQGKSAGVTGTPAFLIGKIKDGKLINGRLIVGARPFSSFSSVVEPLL